MIDIIHDLLANARFVACMSIVWFVCACIARSQTKALALIGTVGHGILALSPILAISTHGVPPEIFPILWNFPCAIAHAVLLFLPVRRGKQPPNGP